ncbi:hypothetical protein HO133_006946 [Letharia lupina]|uniref:Uncharacterized protein n=1 Tax=Letharia lupina TaxID=560253 RepID=A0A8H6CSM1_9LECA|nr:uncharacterized protein HO133_006946 [Letharia lupina]KAF6228835.1 hypothetical protein HO133_006946 [Letharia lupina]
MSFGFSTGDILAVSKLAHDIWVRGLYIVLDDAAQSLPGPKLDQKQMSRLASLVQACQGVHDDTNAVLEEFESLGVKSSSLKVMTQKARKKITWDEEGTEVLRGRIISNTMFLNAFSKMDFSIEFLLAEKCNPGSTTRRNREMAA